MERATEVSLQIRDTVYKRSKMRDFDEIHFLSQWYKQNRQLKRQSTALMQHVIALSPDAISKMDDEVDAYLEQDNEIEALRKTIQGIV
jgi:hypothetical protein